MNSNLEIIRAVCIDANPEIVSVVENEFDGVDVSERPIRFADVLLAIGKKERGHIFARADGEIAVFFKWVDFGEEKRHEVEPTYIEWNLRKDDLTQQSPETLQFLSDLLK